MLLGTRWQVSLSVAIVVLVIGIYTWLDVGPYHDPFRIPQHIFQDELASHEEPNLGAVLRPQDHTNREARTSHFIWNITTGIRAPDGVTKQVYLINGMHSFLFHCPCLIN
jgi:hypothetical protein